MACSQPRSSSPSFTALRTPAGNVDCYDVQKGGAPVLKVEPNLFGGFDLRQSDGKLVRCEKKATDRVQRGGHEARRAPVGLVPIPLVAGKGAV